MIELKVNKGKCQIRAEGDMDTIGGEAITAITHLMRMMLQNEGEQCTGKEFSAMAKSVLNVSIIKNFMIEKDGESNV